MEKGYSFSLKDIEILEKSYVYTPDKPEGDYNFEISLNVNTDMPAGRTVHIFNVVIFINNENSGGKKEGKRQVGSLSVGYIFHIINLNEIALVENNQITLPPDLLSLLNGVVIGTTRGILFSEYRGTVLSNAILPVLDPRSFTK